MITQTIFPLALVAPKNSDKTERVLFIILIAATLLHLYRHEIQHFCIKLAIKHNLTTPTTY